MRNTFYEINKYITYEYQFDSLVRYLYLNWSLQRDPETSKRTLGVISKEEEQNAHSMKTENETVEQERIKRPRM